MPAFCNCEDEDAWGSFESVEWGTHGGYTHPSPNNLKRETLDRIDGMVTKDRQIYDAMRTRFMKQIAEVEESSGTRVLCDDAKRRLSEY